MIGIFHSDFFSFSHNSHHHHPLHPPPSIQFQTWQMVIFPCCRCGILLAIRNNCSHSIHHFISFDSIVIVSISHMEREFLDFFLDFYCIYECKICYSHFLSIFPSISKDSPSTITIISYSYFIFHNDVNSQLCNLPSYINFLFIFLCFYLSISLSSSYPLSLHHILNPCASKTKQNGKLNVSIFSILSIPLHSIYVSVCSVNKFIFNHPAHLPLCPSHSFSWEIHKIFLYFVSYTHMTEGSDLESTKHSSCLSNSCVKLLQFYFLSFCFFSEVFFLGWKERSLRL